VQTDSLFIYKFPNLSWQEVAAMFGLSELKQTRVYQQGREEGREEGEQSLILRQLSRCIGELPDTLRDQIIALPLESLEELGEALLDFEEIEDLQDWLLAHQQRHGR
jgi:predicted transposase YdaD